MKQLFVIVFFFISYATFAQRTATKSNVVEAIDSLKIPSANGIPQSIASKQTLIVGDTVNRTGFIHFPSVYPTPWIPIGSGGSSSDLTFISANVPSTGCPKCDFQAFTPPSGVTTAFYEGAPFKILTDTTGYSDKVDSAIYFWNKDGSISKRDISQSNGYNISWFSPAADGVTNDISVFLKAIISVPDSSVINLTPGKTYLISGNNNISKYIIFNLNGATLKSAALSNTSLTFLKGGEVYGPGTLDNVWIGFSGLTSQRGVVEKCNFVNQTYPATTSVNYATNTTIKKNYFTGHAKGAAGNSTYPCYQVTTGAKNCVFTENYCYDVEAGVTADGINKIIEQISVYNNTFDSLRYYAAKFDVANSISFTHNTVSRAHYGIFYEAIDSAGAEKTRLVGNNVDFSNNTFKDFNTRTFVESALYIAASDNPYTTVNFNGNTIKNVPYGILRSCGHIVAKDNKFYNGVNFFSNCNPVAGLAPTGDFLFESNTIETTRPDTTLADFEGANEYAAILINTNNGSIDTSAWTHNVVARKNTFIDYHTNTVMVARLSTTNIPIRLEDNILKTGDSSFNGFSISAASGMYVRGNKMYGNYTGEALKLVTPSRITGTVIVDGNNWQKASQMPTTGSHVAGEVYTNSGITQRNINGYKYYITGWEHITTSATNDSLTDWIPLYTVDPNYLPTGTSFIVNGTASHQSASFDITGTARVYGGQFQLYSGESNNRNQRLIIQPDTTNHWYIFNSTFSGGTNYGYDWQFSSTSKMRWYNNGHIFIGSSAADNGYVLEVNGTSKIGNLLTAARILLTASNGTASSAPLKFTSGTSLTTPESGTVEYDGNDFYATPSDAKRYVLVRGLKGSATLDFPSTAAQSSSELTITVTGAADGDVVQVGVPNASSNANSCFTARVSATNTVTVKFNNYSSGAIDPASGTFKVIVLK